MGFGDGDRSDKRFLLLIRGPLPAREGGPHVKDMTWQRLKKGRRRANGKIRNTPSR
jgi:hypothetical protein